jgi:acyl-CoA synthetase (AMP-forming)/AMP-acid ligase II
VGLALDSHGGACLQNDSLEFIKHFEQVLTDARGVTALVYKNRPYTYAELSLLYEANLKMLMEKDVKQGSVVALVGDFDPATISFMIALIKIKAVIVPFLRNHTSSYIEEAIQISAADFKITTDSELETNITNLPETNKNQLICDLVTIGAPGLILLSSGSTGRPKAALHNFSKLLSKFIMPGHHQTMINFLMFDHWGGLNTLFYILGGAGTVITTDNRSPENICNLLEKWKIEVLPTSPSFLNLLLLSHSYADKDLSHLKLITYGSEPMPQSTLDKARNAFPNVSFKQTYGLIELGVFKTKSKSKDSLFIKIDPNDCLYRVVDGMLELKTKSAMLGYLNAPSPFTEDGWFKTFDSVEVDGEYIKILGRKSEIIIIGGEKVYPVEIEARILEFPNVEDVLVYKEAHPLMGNIICAKIKLLEQEDEKLFIIKIKKFCAEIFPTYKVPSRIKFSTEALSGLRQKKVRI